MFQSKLSSSSSSATTTTAPATDVATGGDDLTAALTFLSKKLEMMGMSGLAVTTVGDDSGGGEADFIELVNASLELVGRVRQLEKSKQERDDYGQQLLQDLQRCQWLLERQKELCVQRERDAAEACEKERQAGVRLLQVELLLKKKNEQHRQLVGESQLKESQWQHALRRRDVDNHKLHQQLLKLLRTKSGSHGTGVAFVPLELEIRDTLFIPPAARIAGAASLSTSVRRKWDRAEDSLKFAQDKWKSVLTAMEKEQQLLRSDYQSLLELIRRFFTNLSGSIHLCSNIKEWIQLPMSMMQSRLEEAFHCVEKQCQRWMESAAGAKGDSSFDCSSGRQPSIANETVLIRLEADREEAAATAATSSLWLNPLKEEHRIVDGNEPAAPSTSGHVVTAATAGHHMGTNGVNNQPETNAIPISHGVERNDDGDDVGFVRQNTVITRRVITPVPAVDSGPTESTKLCSNSPLLKKAIEQITQRTPHRVVVDTPCPSGANSRRNSSSSSSSDSSSVNSCYGIEQLGNNSRTETQHRSSVTDEQFFQEWSDAASLASFSKNNSSSNPLQQASLSINNSASITAKVSVVQRPPPPTPVPIFNDSDGSTASVVGLSLKFTQSD